MKRSGILRQQRGGLIDQGTAILDAATQANRALTADEVTRHDGILAQIEALNAEIQRAERQEALDAESRAVPAPVVGRDADPPENRGGGQDTDAAVRGAWYAMRFKNIPAGAEQIAKELYREDYSALAFRKHRDYGRYLRTGQIDDGTLARTLLLSPQQIVNAAAHGVTVSEIRATMIEGDDTLGGYLVPEDVRLDMIERLPGLTAVRPRANVITTSRDRVSFPRVTGGDSQYVGAVRVTWVDETPVGTEAATNATFGQVAIPIHTVMAHIDLSRNLLEDSAIDLGSYLGGEMTSASAIDEDAKFLASAGAGTPQGVLLNNTTGGPNDADVTTVATGAAAALTADGIIKMPFGLSSQYRQSASLAWVMAKGTLQEVSLLKDGQGRYLYGEISSPLTGMPMPVIKGYPVAESESMPAVAANTYPIILADWRGYMIADRIGMSMERISDATLAKKNLISFVMRRRLGGQVTHPFRFVVQKVAVS